jgi:lysophospholipase L1-like esterase
MSRPLAAVLRGVALALVSLAAFLLVSELAFRLYLTRHTFYDVEMARYAASLKKNAEDPLIGHVHRPNRSAELMGVRVEINSDGLRDDETPRAKGERWRILFLGDSLTFGWGVEKDETFEARLERQLQERRPTEILNFGIGNYNTTQEVQLFLEKGLAYRPDQVVLFYFINDAEPVPRRSRWAWLGHARILTFYWSRLRAAMARLSPRAGFREYYASLYAPGSAGWARTQRSFATLADACRERGIALQAVLLPELHELGDYPFAEQHRLVMEALREQGIPALDLAPLFPDVDPPERLWVARDDAHPNARAHEIIARLTRDFIAEGSK